MSIEEGSNSLLPGPFYSHGKPVQCLTSTTAKRQVVSLLTSWGASRGPSKVGNASDCAIPPDQHPQLGYHPAH